MAICDGSYPASDVVVGAAVVVVGAGVDVGAVVLGGSVVLGAGVVVVGASVVVVGGSELEGGGSVVVAGGACSSLVTPGAIGSGRGAAGESVGGAVVDVTDVVAGVVLPASLFTNRTMPHTSPAISSAVSTPQPINASGLRYQGVGGGGSDQPGCGPGSRYWL